MNPPALFYLANIGMITPVGANTAMTAAAVNAGMSAYTVSAWSNQHGLPITMTAVPDAVFDHFEADIGGGDRFNFRHDRVIKMAIIALHEATARHTTPQPVSLLLAMPETPSGPYHENGLMPLVQALEDHLKPWIDSGQNRRFYSGRAAGLEAIDFGFRHQHALPGDFLLIGGSDSYADPARLNPLAAERRLQVTGSPDAFVPGEAAGFLLLTRHPELALARNGHIIALHPPGLAEEPGHLYSEQPYRGEGLDQAFKKALLHHPQPHSIHSIYSSMNGENHWAKEYGVAFIRNAEHFIDPVRFEHPADCYGDLGAATAPVLIALAADHLFNHATAQAHLVYSSSDHGQRGAIVVQKIAFEKTTATAKPPQHLSNV